MSDHRGTREQSSDPPPSGTRAEQVFCTLACTVLAVAVILCLVEQGHDVQLPRGLYAILASGIVIGGVGWTVVWAVSRAEARVAAGIEADQREVFYRLAELTSTVEALTRAVVQSRPAPMPSRYISGSSAVAAQGDTVPVNPVVDPAAADALRRLNVRLLRGGSDS